VDQRLQMTQIILDALKTFGEKYDIPVLHSIRVDATVPKAMRARKFLADFDAECKAAQDYRIACAQVSEAIVPGKNGEAAA
jgi:hypothetical protein